MTEEKREELFHKICGMLMHLHGFVSGSEMKQAIRQAMSDLRAFEDELTAQQESSKNG